MLMAVVIGQSHRSTHLNTLPHTNNCSTRKCSNSHSSEPASNGSYTARGHAKCNAEDCCITTS